MGLDVRLYVETEDVELAPEYEFDLALCLSPHAEGSVLYYGRADGGWLTIEGYERFWSPDYPRGAWPLHRAALLYLRKRYPRAELRYGSDHDDGAGHAETVTTEWLAACDEAWLACPDPD